MTIRIVHLVSTLGIGGQEMVILSLVRHMDRSRFTPVVFALSESGPLAERITGLGVDVEVIGNPGMSRWAKVRSLNTRLRAQRVDILHTHNPSPHQYGAAARLLGGVPALIHTKHGRNVLLSRAGQWAELVAGRLSDLIVPVSSDAAEVARQVERVPAHKLRVIRNGIAIDGAPVAHVLPEGRPPRAIHVARLNHIKDQVTLLRATRRVADQVPGFTLEIVGDGEMREPLHALARDLRLDDVVHFLGMRDDIPALLANADLFVLPSLSEGVAITLLEAMVAGLPVVASDVGGNREVVVPSLTGLLCPAGDTEALADAILETISDPVRARAWGRAGRDRAAREFNILRTVAAYEAAYQEIVSRKQPRRTGIS